MQTRDEGFAEKKWITSSKNYNTGKDTKKPFHWSKRMFLQHEFDNGISQLTNQNIWKWRRVYSMYRILLLFLYYLKKKEKKTFSIILSTNVTRISCKRIFIRGWLYASCNCWILRKICEKHRGYKCCTWNNWRNMSGQF